MKQRSESALEVSFNYILSMGLMADKNVLVNFFFILYFSILLFHCLFFCLICLSLSGWWQFFFCFCTSSWVESNQINVRMFFTFCARFVSRHTHWVNVMLMLNVVWPCVSRYPFLYLIFIFFVVLVFILFYFSFQFLRLTVYNNFFNK